MVRPPLSQYNAAIRQPVALGAGHAYRRRRIDNAYEKSALARRIAKTDRSDRNDRLDVKQEDT